MSLTRANTNRKAKATCCDDLGDKLLALDAFEENFSMKLEKGNSGLNTSFGSILTILVYCTVLLYTYMKVDVLIMKKDVDIMSTTMINSIPNDFVVSHDSIDLNLAIAFTKFDSEPNPILDKSYGRLVFNVYEWG